MFSTEAEHARAKESLEEEEAYLERLKATPGGGRPDPGGARARPAAGARLSRAAPRSGRGV